MTTMSMATGGGNSKFHRSMSTAIKRETGLVVTRQYSKDELFSKLMALGLSPLQQCLACKKANRDEEEDLNQALRVLCLTDPAVKLPYPLWQGLNQPKVREDLFTMIDFSTVTFDHDCFIRATELMQSRSGQSPSSFEEKWRAFVTRGKKYELHALAVHYQIGEEVLKDAQNISIKTWMKMKRQVRRRNFDLLKIEPREKAGEIFLGVLESIAPNRLEQLLLFNDFEEWFRRNCPADFQKFVDHALLIVFPEEFDNPDILK